MMDMQEVSQRFDRLETKTLFVEDAVDELNRTVFRQQQQIERLQQQVRALAEQLAALRPAGIRDLRDEIPPHY